MLCWSWCFGYALNLCSCCLPAGGVTGTPVDEFTVEGKKDIFGLTLITFFCDCSIHISSTSKSGKCCNLACIPHYKDTLQPNFKTKLCQNTSSISTNQPTLTHPTQSHPTPSHNTQPCPTMPHFAQPHPINPTHPTRPTPPNSFTFPLSPHFYCFPLLLFHGLWAYAFHTKSTAKHDNQHFLTATSKHDFSFIYSNFCILFTCSTCSTIKTNHLTMKRKQCHTNVIPVWLPV